MSREAPAVAGAALRLFENRYLLVLGIAIVVVAGLAALRDMPRIEDPRITNRYPQIITTLPGASAERVEALVTDPIEDSLREMSEIKELRSTSRAGISIINAELQDFIGPGENQQVFSKMRDRLADVTSTLPAGASAPELDDEFSAVAYSVIASLSWPYGGEPEFSVMNRLADDLADRFRSLGGTDNVRVFGAPDEEVSVTVDAAELASLGLSAARVAQAIASADAKLPAGVMRGAERDLYVEVDGELDSVERIRNLPLIDNGSGQVVTVGSVATVRKDWREPPSDIALADGRRGVLVAAQTRRDVRVDAWAERARSTIDEFRRDAAAGIEVDVVFDQSSYTEERLSTLSGNLLAGAGLVALIVFVGMGWRAAMIVCAALPLSAALTLFGLSIAGQQIHQMSIFGMIIAIGLLIDNAIVMTDEVKKKLDAGAERLDAVRQALSHLFVPLLAATLTTVLGFMPVFLLPGAMGDFVGPIAISVVLALTASFFVAVSIIPALAGLFLRRRAGDARQGWWVDGFCSERLANAYRRALGAAVARPVVTVVAAIVLPIAGFVLSGTLGQQFFPPADRDQFEIEVWLPQDASMRSTEAVARRIEARLREEDAVTEVHWRIGGSFPTIYYNRIMKMSGNSAYAHAMVYTDSVQSAKRLTGELPRELADSFPEARVVVAPFAQGPPVDAPVGFRIEGPSIAVLKSLGDELRRIMHSVPEIVQTRASVSGGQAKLNFVPDEMAASAAGLTLTGVAGQLQAGLEGQVGGSILEDLEELPVRVRVRDSDRNSAGSVASLSFVTPLGEGRWVPASGIGSVELVPEAGSISRRDGVRANNVLGYIVRDALAIDVTNAVLARVAEEGFSVPHGYAFSVAGDSAEQSEAFGSLLTYLPVLVMLMVATLVLSFRSMRLAALIGVVAVLSVGLGMLSLWIGGYARGFNAIIGSLGLVGVAINGTIVVLAAIRANPAAAAGDRGAIVDETIGATRHIVSTTLTTIGGFIPLLLFTGGDFWPPLAIVIAGGVGFSVTLSLVFTPAVYRLLCHGGKVRASSALGTGSGEVLAS